MRWRWPRLGDVRALVIDFGGVLTTSLRESFEAFCREEGIDYERIRESLREAYGGEDTGSLVSLVETGRLPVPEFEHRLAATLSRDLGRPIASEGLVRRMVRGISLDEAMVDLVRRARAAGIRTVLLSNSWGLEYYPHELLAEIFDVVLISGEVGMRKPNADVYAHAVERAEVPPAACVFVDDVAGNVEAAERAGMRGYVHEDPRRSVPDLELMLGMAPDERPPAG